MVNSGIRPTAHQLKAGEAQYVGTVTVPQPNVLNIWGNMLNMWAMAAALPYNSALHFVCNAWWVTVLLVGDWAGKLPKRSGSHPPHKLGYNDGAKRGP